jgi:predicted ATP-binding protein involved in virulence
MQISQLKVNNFRNIVSADIHFNKINVFTGKNSSGKSNLLKVIANVLDSREKQGEIFDANVTTYGKGYRDSDFEVIISDISQMACYLLGGESYKCITPEKVKFTKTVSKKNSLATDFEMFFTGKILDGEKSDEKLQWFEQIQKDSKEKKASRHTDWRVFGETYGNVEKADGKRIFKTTTDDADAQNFKRLHKSYEKSIIQWIESSGKPKSSSNIVHEYVIQDYGPQIAEEILELLSKKEVQSKRIMDNDSLSKSLFAFIVADIQVNKKIYDEFKYELKHYSEGILDDVYIQTSGKDRGELFISSPNGPKSIRSISAGSAIILFFVALKNWLKLGVVEQSYDTPSVMIFDEIDSNVHPLLLESLAELLKSMSSKVQIFLTTHSPFLLDHFSKEEVFLLMDSSQSLSIATNRVNILSYQNILENALSLEKNSSLEKMSNSELFSEGVINNLFHG